MNYEYKFFSKLFYYPLALIPVFLISGPFLSDLVITLSGLAFLIISLKNKDYRFFSSFFFKYFIFFYLFISSLYFLYDETKIYFLLKPFSMIRFILFVGALSYLISYKKSFIDLFLKVLILSLSLLFLDSLFQFFYGKNILSYEISGTGRVSSFFKDELIMGSYTMRFFPVLITIIFYKNFLRKNLLLSVLFFICTTLILLSGERTSLILFLIFVVSFILLSENFIKKKFLFLFSILFILASVIFLNPSFKTRFIDNVLYFFSGTNSDNKIKIISDEHQGVFYSAYDIFSKKPIIGSGINSFRKVCKNVKYKEDQEFFNKFKCSSHPHNIYLQLLSETGFFSFFLIFTIFIYFSLRLIRILFKSIKIQNHNLSLYLSFFITLFPLAPSGNMFNNWLNIIYFLPVAFYLGLNQNFNKKI